MDIWLDPPSGSTSRWFSRIDITEISLENKLCQSSYSSSEQMGNQIIIINGRSLTGL